MNRFGSRKKPLFLCVLLCLALFAGSASAAPGSLFVTRVFERDGTGVFLFDAVNAAGSPLALAVDQVELAFGDTLVATVSLESLRDADESVAVLLLLDTSYALGSGEKTRLTRAVKEWIGATREGDKLALVTCGGEPAMRADFVSSHPLLEAAAGGIEYGVKGDTFLYDGLRLAAEMIERRADELPARVAVVAFTDGMDEGSAKTTAEEAVTLLRSMGATLSVVAVGNSPEAAEALAFGGAYARVGGGKADKTIDGAFTALRDRLLDSYLLRFFLESVPAGGFYAATLTARDDAGEIIATGGVLLRAPDSGGADAGSPVTNATGALAEALLGDAPVFTLARLSAPVDTPSGEALPPTERPSATEIAPTDAPSIAPSDDVPAESPTVPPTLASAPPEGQGLLDRGLSFWNGLSETERLVALGVGILALGLICAGIILLCVRARKRRQKREIEAREASEPRLSPPPAEEADQPTVQTNIVVRPPVYQPVSAEPYTHLRQPAPTGEADEPIVSVTFRIIGPTGAVENRTLLVSEGFTIGRELTCGLFIKDARLTKRHLVLGLPPEGGLLLRGVKAGMVLVNGGKAEGDYPLHSGDTLRLGRVSVMVQYSE